jgi:hypothetical protein
VRRCKGEGRNQRATRRQDAGASQGSDEGKHWGEGDGEARIRRGGPAWGPPPICAPASTHSSASAPLSYTLFQLTCMPLRAPSLS